MNVGKVRQAKTKTFHVQTTYKSSCSAEASSVAVTGSEASWYVICYPSIHPFLPEYLEVIFYCKKKEKKFTKSANKAYGRLRRNWDVFPCRDFFCELRAYLWFNQFHANGVKINPFFSRLELTRVTHTYNMFQTAGERNMVVLTRQILLKKKILLFSVRHHGCAQVTSHSFFLKLQYHDMCFRFISFILTLSVSLSWEARRSVLSLIQIHSC